MNLNNITAAVKRSQMYAWLTLFSLVVVSTMQYLVDPMQSIIPRFVGRNGTAIFDLWFFQHFASGVIIAWLGWALFKKFHALLESDRFWDLVIRATLAALLYEIVELLADTGYLDQLLFLDNTFEKMFGGLEHWTNRIICDPIAMILGILAFGKARYHGTGLFALGITAAWWSAIITQGGTARVYDALFGS